MATAYLRAESVPVILPKNFAQAAALLAQFDRATIASTIEVLVNLLDVLEDDPDRELCGTEDDITDRQSRDHTAYGAGCAISDPAEDDSEDAEHDGREEQHEN